MTIVLLLVPAMILGAINGFLGRKGRFGFWGFFALTIAAAVAERMTIGSMLSPFVLGFFLFISAPSKRFEVEIETRLAKTLQRTAALPPAAQPPTTSTISQRAASIPLRALIGTWAGMIVVFSVVYFLVGPPAPLPLPLSVTMRPANASVELPTETEQALFEVPFTFADAFAVSFDAATLGNGGLEAHRSGWLPVIVAVERMITVLMLVVLISNLAAARAAGLGADRNGNRQTKTSIESVTSREPATVTTASVVESRAS
jgi:hypothetical protein